MSYSDDEYKRVLDANIQFHSALVEKDVYKQQPYLSKQNRVRVKSLLQELAARAPVRSLLDVGTGTGFIPDVGYDLFEEIIGTDITPMMLNHAKSIKGLRVLRAAGEALPLCSDHFGVITAYGVAWTAISIPGGLNAT